MRRTINIFAAVALTAAIATPNLLAQDYQVRDEFLTRYNAAVDKIVQLAEAVPQEKYDWRPMEGVRSFSEVAMHVASANYFFASKFGGTNPEGVNPQEFSTITDKAEAIATLKASVEHVQAAAAAANAANAATKHPLFGEMETTEMGAMLFALDHAAEHLGQMIAYARSNEIAPPWSQ
jgi:uncharacterized damage-inducible protein DinB